MPTYNFKEQFVPFVQDGTKTQTVRAYRKDGRLPKVGEPCNLFYGMRTKHCKRILPPDNIIWAVNSIYIFEDATMVLGEIRPQHEALERLADKQLLYKSGTAFPFTKEGKNTFAWKDGFRPPGSTINQPGNAFELMLQFFIPTHQLPFCGTVTFWK